MNKPQLLILMIPVIFFSLTVHEYSHGKIAFLLGDNTAKLLGRLSFNPFKHLDLMGTLFFCFVGFGWAKPVPVNPRNFDQPRRDMMYVAIAGPLSNLTLAVIFSFFIRIIGPYDNAILFTLLSFGVYVNVALAIPPPSEPVVATYHSVCLSAPQITEKVTPASIFSLSDVQFVVA